MAYEIVLGRTESARKRMGLRGTIFIGKHYVTMGETKSLSNTMHLDIAKPHVILVSGKRGSGKSYTLAVMAEGLANLEEDIRNNISTLIFDTMGIFWTSKYPNYKDDKLLQEWELRPQGIHITIYVPQGLFDEYLKKGVPADYPFSLRPADITAEEWATIFRTDLLSDEGIILERAVTRAKEQFKEYDLDDLASVITKDVEVPTKARHFLINKFEAIKAWGLFSKNGTSLKDLTKGGTTNVLDLSAYTQVEGGMRIKALVIGLLSKKILETRMAARKGEEIKLIEKGSYLAGEAKEVIAAEAGEEAPMVWIMIDEAHEFLPKDGTTLASLPLIQLLREGRQPGISAILATQQPGKIHTDVMTQSDIVISHRVTAKIDIDALSAIMQSYLPVAISKYIDGLPREKGAAIILDDKLEKIYPMRIRPRLSWHGGAEPAAVPT